jgi:outer membrane protein assembly factor BamE (lipoprotein component of BamABCDE complex)
MKLMLCSLLLLVAVGCATQDPIKMETLGHVRPGATAHLEIGMPKARVIQLLGTPLSVNAAGGTETLVYLEERPWWNWVKIGVHCTNGAVASFGELRSVPAPN